ncbi:MAG TPA: GNAT family N-acetyltransferase [Gaiellaceae bacterium]|nr:GNAT family N-acetyltransferase [Gaiellaceae bacterium]
MKVERVSEASDELVEALVRLLPQVSTTAPAPTRDSVADLLARNDHYVLVARDDDGRIVGSLTLIVYRTMGRVQGTIHDVVVDETSRGQGIGEALTVDAQRLAVGAGAESVRLTSRSHRAAAHRLYERLGFEPVDTQVYVWRPH